MPIQLGVCETNENTDTDTNTNTNQPTNQPSRLHNRIHMNIHIYIILQLTLLHKATKYRHQRININISSPIHFYITIIRLREVLSNVKIVLRI